MLPAYISRLIKSVYSDGGLVSASHYLHRLAFNVLCKLAVSALLYMAKKHTEPRIVKEMFSTMKTFPTFPTLVYVYGHGLGAAFAISLPRNCAKCLSRPTFRGSCTFPDPFLVPTPLMAFITRTQI